MSRSGVLPLSPSMDCVGPIAWTVKDCALMISSMVSSDPEDLERKGFRLPDISALDEAFAACGSVSSDTSSMNGPFTPRSTALS